MSKYKIKSINYISCGKKTKFLNLSIVDDDSFNLSAIGAEKTSQDSLDNIALGENGNAIQVFLEENDVKKYKTYNTKTTVGSITVVAGNSRNLEYDPTLIITNKEKDIDNFQECNNVYSLYDIDNGNIIHPLFDVKDLCYQSYIRKYADFDDSKNLSEHYLDILAPQFNQDVLACPQLCSSIFILTDTVKNYIGMKQALGISKYSDTPETAADIDYTFQISEYPLKTITYTNVPRDNDDANRFDIKREFNNIDYNCVIEVPSDFEKYNDFKSGNIFGNILFCKNYYNSMYSTQMSSETRLDNFRQYIGAFSCGEKIYLKYLDDTTYQSNDSVNKTQPIEKFDSIAVSYQKIESIDVNMMYRNNIKHRSSIYSIEIDKTGLDKTSSQNTLNKLREQIIQEIKNNVRLISQAVSPANTTLFDVKIQG